MPVSTDIAEARALLERAERESDPEQESRHIEEALALLETVENPTDGEITLIEFTHFLCAPAADPTTAA